MRLRAAADLRFWRCGHGQDCTERHQQGGPHKQDPQLATACWGDNPHTDTPSLTHPHTLPHTTHPSTPNPSPLPPPTPAFNPSTQARTDSLLPIRSIRQLTHPPHIHHTLPSTPLLMQMIKALASQPLDVSFIPIHHHPPPTASSISSKRAFHSHFLISLLSSSPSPHS